MVGRLEPPWELSWGGFLFFCKKIRLALANQFGAGYLLGMSNLSIPAAARIIREANPGIDGATAMTWAWQAYREAQAQQEERAAAARAAFFISRQTAARGERFAARVRAAKVLTGKERGEGRSAGRFARGMACAYSPPADRSVD